MGKPKALANSLLAVTAEVFGLHLDIVDSLVSLRILAFVCDWADADLQRKTN